MVGHHVPQRAGGIVEAPAMLDADRLGGRDLNAMDMVAIPYRLEQAVGEAQHHDVLDRLLPEEMVDAVDLAFVGQLQDPRVERPRSEEHTSELQSLMRISYAVFCLKKKTINTK